MSLLNTQTSFSTSTRLVTIMHKLNHSKRFILCWTVTILVYCTIHDRKALHLLKYNHVCSPNMQGDLNILNIHTYMLACKATLLHSILQWCHPWTIMLSCLVGSLHMDAFCHHIPIVFYDVIFGHFHAKHLVELCVCSPFNHRKAYFLHCLVLFTVDTMVDD